MNERCVVVGNEFLTPKYIAEDDIHRNGGRWPEYANTMMICIDSFANGLACGRLYNFYFEEASPFASLDQLLFAMESVMEKAQMPQAFLELRQPIPMATKKKRGRKAEKQELEDKPLSRQLPFYSMETMQAVRGKLANFHIRVYARQHASVQGVLITAEKGVTYPFRSELELICFLRDLLSESTTARDE